MNDFPHLRFAVLNTPWAIMQDRLEAIVEVLDRRINFGKLPADEIAAIRGDRKPNGVLEFRSLSDTSSVLSINAASGNATPSGGVIAVINMMGIVAQHASQVDNVSGPGGTSTERVGLSFDAAVKDPNVKAIVFNIDSPGGSVNGVQALADKIYKARGTKPIIAQVNSLAASAAYWLATQADEIVMTPGAQAGSIGVYATHKDVSAAADKEGVKVSFISAGKFKVDGNPFEPLTDTARSSMQESVDAYYADFTKAVARGRGVSVDAVRTGFGEGRVMKDTSAVKEKMADSIGTLSETLDRVASERRQSARARAVAPELPIEAFSGLGILVLHNVSVKDGADRFALNAMWSAKVSLSADFLDSSSTECVLDADAKTLTLTALNGIATYKILGKHPVSGDLLCALADHVWEEPPVSGQSPEDRDAFRRRRHAARLRRV